VLPLRISLNRQPKGCAFVPLLIPFVAGILLASCAQIAERPKSPSALIVLDDRELDSVAAGTVSVDLELSATATGPTAVTSTQGTILSGRTTVLRIAFDPSAPPAAAVQLVGASNADVVMGAGTADAAGSSNVQCSAIPTVVGDFTALAASHIAAPTSATCSCTALAIGFLNH